MGGCGREQQRLRRVAFESLLYKVLLLGEHHEADQVTQVEHAHALAAALVRSRALDHGGGLNAAR